MKKIIGWVETILGFVVSIVSILAMITAKTMLTFNPEGLPSEISGMLDPILGAIPLVAISYFVIILLLGIFIFLEGLSKLDKN